MDTKTLVCLANSRKHQDLCVAGIELTAQGVGTWVRPVSARAGHGISTAEQTLTDGSVPSVLDVISIGLAAYTPDDFQTENWLVDPTCRWQRVGRWTHADASAIVDEPAALWSNDGSSSVGVHDRVPVAELAAIDTSIVLVDVDDPEVVVSRNPWSRDIEVRLGFSYRGTHHELKITDPRYHAAYLGERLGRYGLHPKTLVTVSLAEPWVAPSGGEAYSYKVVAAIIEPEH